MKRQKSQSTIDSDLERDLDRLEAILQGLAEQKLRLEAMLATEKLVGRELSKHSRAVIGDDGRVWVIENKNRAVYDPVAKRIAFAEFEEEDVVDKTKWLRVEPAVTE